MLDRFEVDSPTAHLSRPSQRAAIENLTKILKGAGVTRDSVVKCNIYLTNLPRDFAPMNEVYREVRPP